MKKIIAALVVLAIAAPAMATNVNAVQIDGNSVQITYDASGDGDLVRAFGIDVTLDTDVNFTDASGTSADYPIFPGSIAIDMFGEVSNYGTPVGSVDDHPDTQPGLDSNGVTIEMGSLYASGDPAPAVSGDLLVLDIGGVGLDPVIPPVFNLSMADNTARGGIVLEGGRFRLQDDNEPIYLSTLTATEYAQWLAWGGGDPSAAPSNWRSYCWKCGDTNGDGLVLFGDVIAVFGYFKDATSNGEGDANMDGLELFGDVIQVFGQFKAVPDVRRVNTDSGV